jgi:methionyl-tRNA formyltransferase
MRIVLVGQAAFAEQTLSGLIDAGHQVAAVYAPPDAAGKVDPLAAEGRRRGLDVRTPSSYKGPQVAKEVDELHADLGVLAFVTKIIPPAVIDAPRQGTICFHPSLLPRYRGGSALAWQLIRGETRGGFTIFWTDPGIDTGPILLQRGVEIAPDDTAASLYFDKIFKPGVAAMVEAVGLIEAGRAPRIEQDPALASYDPLLTDAYAAIDWSRPVGEVYNLIRGCDPQPGAFTSWRGERLRVHDARRSEAPGQQPAAPGSVITLDERGLVVGVGQGGDAGAITVGRVRAGAAKQKAAEFARAAGLSPGCVLGAG